MFYVRRNTSSKGITKQRFKYTHLELIPNTTTWDLQLIYTQCTNRFKLTLLSIKRNKLTVRQKNILGKINFSENR